MTRGQDFYGVRVIVRIGVWSGYGSSLWKKKQLNTSRWLQFALRFLNRVSRWAFRLGFFRLHFQLERGICACTNCILNSPIRYISQEFTDYIGHVAVGLGVRAKLGLLQKSVFEYEILTESVDTAFLRYFPFPVHHLTSLEMNDFQKKHWSSFERIGAVATLDGTQFLYEALSKTETLWDLKMKAPLLYLLDSDREIAGTFLSRKGFSLNDRFVTIHVRGSKDPRSLGRNANIQDFEEVVKEITSQDKWVIRLGDSFMPPMSAIEGLIDLTQSNDRPKQVDIFALAECDLMIGTQSGPSTVPQLFGRPVIWTNATALGIIPWFSKTLVLPKLIWDAKQRRKFNIEELLESRFSKSDDISPIYRDRYSWINSEVEDIIIAIREIATTRTEQEKSLQIQFNAKRKQIVDYRGPDISPSFLLKYFP